mmetsp:Transcript_23883/g.32833  ORF Transcript_23883/g.32833 Transcript_23883/m.32833 type:complete len:652 (+) Transcript_23883:108-2063(+)|eukprot:CAMPEP_0196591658 /NCGR_PEP_ID=MMETSP1081-20130531/70472_1 /TAXON_ID=36882 /ORGANISM="Pyramimonas amylifera, Strain CCMP720" /LENGTH=651 /DNA_ID=CAMNT_0041915089 /DNA_START=107 /DNA_END=2062 /DNA_ORIENTATION=+
MTHFLNHALCLLLLLPSFCAYRTLELKVISLDQLKSPSADEAESLSRSLREVGMLAVTTQDGSARSAGRVALQAFSDCIQDRTLVDIFARESSSSEVVRSVTLEDGTLRRTVATATNLSTPQPLGSTVSTHCPVFSVASEVLRQQADDVGISFAGLLDHLSDDPATSLTGPSPSCSHTSFVEAVRAAESLEHFHLFQQGQEEGQSGSKEKKPTLHMHSDMGLFIVMTPGEFFESHQWEKSDNPEAQDKAMFTSVPTKGSENVPERGSGLFLELPSGEVVAPKFPKDCFLVLGGEGAKRWISRPEAVPLYAPAHEVVLPSLQSGRLVRAWYGRMFFPPRSATLMLPPDDPALTLLPVSNRTQAQVRTSLTFGELREQTYSAFLSGQPEIALTAGCHPVRRTLADENSCTGEQIYCWMSCQSTADLECDTSEALCRSPTGALWPQDFTDSSGTVNHCEECSPVCPASNTPATQAGHICNNHFQASVMWMTGFQVLGDDGQPCVALLFEGWELDTTFKFTLGCVGTFFMGICVEGIVAGRRLLVKNKWNKKKFPKAISVDNSERLIQFLMLFIYAFQVMLGYFLMLIAMTYQVELFVLVVLGLTAGHGLFNMKAPVLESAEACCQGFDVEADDVNPIPTAMVSICNGVLPNNAP